MSSKRPTILIATSYTVKKKPHLEEITLPAGYVTSVAAAWRELTRAGDGLIEALEDQRTDRFFLGVQWHPESLHRETCHLALFKALVREARRCRNEKQ